MSIKYQLTYLFLSIGFLAQAQDSLHLSRQEAEAIFLRQNLILLAERLEIPKAEAQITQAKLWPNPGLEIEEVNLWATQRQLSVFGDELQGFNGRNFGKNQQFSFSIEQQLITAGKRKKLIAMEEVNLDKSHQYFEDLLRNLKLEFRNSLTQLQFLQFRARIYEKQMINIQKLTQAYRNQVEKGNVPKGEYIRLRALELAFLKNINDLSVEVNEIQKELKTWMRIPFNVHLLLSDEDFHKDIRQITEVRLGTLLESSAIHRPDLMIVALDQTYFKNLYEYEKAHRIPDFTAKIGYDRGGNFMYNFVGFGVAMDLPLFNRNKGNISSAKIEIEKSKLLYKQKDLAIQNEISNAYQNLHASIKFYESIEPGYESTLDALLDSYTKNFSNKNLSLLEFLDFIDAYLENKNIILEAGKEVNNRAEELNYSVGTDII